MSEPFDILFFSPHPDDAELGCGGSIILASDQGLRVSIADLSAGEMSSRGSPIQRENEREKATRLLGLRDRRQVGLPDTRIGHDPGQRGPLIELIRETRPRMVLAPYWQDRHPDHAAAGKLVREACFFAGVAKLGSGLPHRPANLIYYMIHTPFPPSFIVDVSTVWERRQAAIQAYSSQFLADAPGVSTAISRPEFIRLIEARAVWYGAMIGAEYGEPFLMQGPIGLGGLPLSPDNQSQDGIPGYQLF